MTEPQSSESLPRESDITFVIYEITLLTAGRDAPVPLSAPDSKQLSSYCTGMRACIRMARNGDQFETT
jgi:hypothetical protein